MMRRTQRALLLLTATSSVRVNALAASRVFNVQLPKLPSGGELQLFEGLEDAGDDDDGDSLAELFTVGGTVWPCAASQKPKRRWTMVAPWLECQHACGAASSSIHASHRLV